MMTRTQQRQVVRDATLNVILLSACTLAVISVLSFDSADPPAAMVWPAPAVTHNWCGSLGALFAYYAFYYFGIGIYAVLAAAIAAVCVRMAGRKVSDLWMRTIGVGLATAAVAGAGASFATASSEHLVTGPGGVLGAGVAFFLRSQLDVFGSVVMLVAVGFVGLILAADEIVMAVGRWLLRTTRDNGPTLVRGGSQMFATAGAAVASGVSSVGRTVAGMARPEPEQRETRAPLPRRRTRVAPAQVLTGAGPEKDEVLVDAAEEPDDEIAGADDDGDAEDAEDFEESEDSDDGADEIEDADEQDGDDAEEDETLPPVTATVSVAPRPVLPARAPATWPGGGGIAGGENATPYELPPLALLDDPEAIDRGAIESLCREKAFILEQTLTEFRLQVQVVAIDTGPVITVFELKLAPGIKVSQIASLTNDMARALKAPAVRVVAPLPGKNTIGIEVPNLDKEKVRLKDLLRQASARSDTSAIPLFLGKDASGRALVADLTKMPHLLIAGTTGSGKSVCVASIIMSVLLTRTPAQVQLVMVDPKVVELAMFKDIPHLMCPIVTECSKAESILDWAANKMDERYALLAEAGVKDIRSYNKLSPEELRERMSISDEEEMRQIPVHLPYIVIIIDELADLMMTSAKEVEFYLCRLAQKSRAVGIHLIVSTQRPQANVVTGLIKSNLPSRIAFRVSSRLDSRIVLDQNGAEVLMGQGDMLFLPPGSAKLLRAQGTFVSDEELRSVVKHARSQGEPQYHPELIRMPRVGGEGSAERDELFDQAVEIIIEAGRGSVSLLQRKLMVGYGRASRLVDQMYDAGVVGEYKGSQAREVVMTLEEWNAVRNNRDRAEREEAEEL